VVLAQALIHRPELVFLDEPTSGLDPLGRRLVRDLIQELRATGTTVFLNSHLLSEIEVTCDRVAFIRHGQLVHCGPLQELLAPETEVEVTLAPGSAIPESALAALDYPAEAHSERITVHLPDEALVPDLVERLVSLGARIQSVQPRRSSLEEVFLSLMEGEEAG